MIDNKTVLVVIPARGGSTRLKRKNIFPICGRPMIYWGIKACLASKYIDKITVSTEDKEIKEYVQSLKEDITIIDRPAELADNFTFKQEAIVHAVENTEKHDIVISLQPNSPEIRDYHLDKALEKFIRYDRNELISVDAKLIQNAAFRIMKYDTVFQKTLSTKCGAFVADCIDVHNEEDVKIIERCGRLDVCMIKQKEQKSSQNSTHSTTVV